MQITKWVAVMLTVCMLGGKAFSQSVDDIINKNIDAMGGKDKLATYTTEYMETSNSIMGNDLPAKIWITNALGYRMEMDMMGAKMVVVINKDTGWIINPMTGNTQPTPLPQKEAQTYARQMNIAGPFLNYAARGYTATLLGNDKVNGKDTYKIKLTKAGEEDVTYYIDATTYYIDKRSSNSMMQGQEMQQDIVFTDYQKTPDGIVYPSGYTIGLPQGDLVTTVTKIVFNQPVDPKLYQNQ
jgi:hypothetical protein